MSGMTISITDLFSLRDAVGTCLGDLGDRYDNMLVLTADVDVSSRIGVFREKYPDRCYNVGIAEQSLMSTAAGLAHEGFKPLCFAFAPFASMRCYEQVRTDICYSALPVIIIGNGAGYSNGASGCTHCGLEDSALMVACNNMTVIEPGDPFQMVQVLEAAMEWNRPVYIRMGREATHSLYAPDVRYEIGKALVPREGDDGAFVCTGIMVHFAMEAAERIERELGKRVRVVDMHTIKPLDREAVIKAAEKTGCIVTAEEANILGGLGGAVAEVVTETCPVPVLRVGVKDIFGRSGDPYALLERYELTAKDVAAAARRAVAMKK